MAANHGFADGNKRTTLVLLHVLIVNSGYQLRALPSEDLGRALEDVIVAAASSKTTVESLIEWFRLRIERHSHME
jgi:death-on-curing protein